MGLAKSKKTTFRARAPLRLGLAGGGTDVAPFSEREGGCVLNATVDLYAHAVLEPRDDGRIIFDAADRDEYVEWGLLSQLEDLEPLRLHRAIYNRIVRDFTGGRPLSFRLTTYADAPPGSGLGTSSTMVVCILQVLSEWLNLGFDEYELAQLAFEIEREDLKLAGGKQDQFAAAFGGFNFIEFGPGEQRVLVNPLRIKDWVKMELEASTILYYTGQSRESAEIIKRQIENVTGKASPSMDAMFSLKRDAFLMKEAILKGDLDSYAETLSRSWAAKKSLAENVSNPSLDSIYEDAVRAGAVAGKISGAGGGGFFMFFVPPARRVKVVRALEQKQGRIINFNFTPIGARSWGY